MTRNLLHLFFSDANAHINAPTPKIKNDITTLTNADPEILDSPKKLFSNNFENTKNIFWTPADGSDIYFYPVAIEWVYFAVKQLDIWRGISEVVIPEDVIKDCLEKRAYILLYDTWEGDPWWHYMNMITDLCVNNHMLRPDHFIVISGNTNMPENLPYKYVPLTWFQAINQPSSDFNKSLELIEREHQRDYKFLMMSRRPAEHRLALLTNLWDIRDQGAISFDKWPIMDKILKDTIKKFDIDQNVVDAVLEELPLRISGDCDPSINPVYDGNGDKFFNSYLHVVTETFYGCEDSDSIMFFSEKIFKPMQFLQPFMIMNYANSLEALRSMGYETFSKWFDEGYDLIPDRQSRLVSLGNTIRDVCSQSSRHMALMMKDMKPVLIHNYYQRIKNVDKMDNAMYDTLHSIIL